VTYFDAQKRMQRQRGKAVVVCANGSETSRLLLNSASARFPQGLANSSGVVGKYLMFNTYYTVNAQFEQPLNEFKSVQNTRMVLDFHDTDPKRGFYGGGASTAGSGSIRSPSRSAAFPLTLRPGARVSRASSRSSTHGR
jgi:choline dehydrogenase-like flavoprotein